MKKLTNKNLNTLKTIIDMIYPEFLYATLEVDFNLRNRWFNLNNLDLRETIEQTRNEINEKLNY
jgi:hypothetical protein